MPPQRTIPPAKAIKTERTHEENQERAYIAASRRSDRSLEARVESARRASEIHKRRTGRSLRVTEQDVVNEEMYEEEDDDLPLQYRRLTAHLQTGSANFNRRLAAYLTNHVAMRSALDQAITNSYAQQYPNAPQFAHNQQNMYPSPFMAQSGPQSLGPQSLGPQSLGPQSIGPQSLGPQSLQPQVLQQPSHPSQQSPHSYRQAPYQIPRTPSYRPGVHARSATIGTPHSSTGQGTNVSQSSPVESQSEPNQRRMSMPTPAPSAPVSPVNARPSQQVPSYSTSYDNQPSHPSPPTQPSHQISAPPQPQSFMTSMPGSMHDLGPLTTSLPMESQYLLGSELDRSNPFTSMLMGGTDSLMQSYYPPSPMSAFPKQKGFQSPHNGMNCTLAPSALDMSPDHHSEPLSAATDYASNPIFGQEFESAYPDIFKGSAYRASSSGQGSCHGSGNVTPGHGRITPGLDSWDAFINDSSWGENAT